MARPFRKAALLAGLSLTLGLAACGDQPKQEGAKPLEKISFNMSWLPQGSMAGVILALDKGYYAKAGLDVDVVRGFGGVRTANELDQGMFQFAYGDPISVALNRANGGHIRMVGAINTRWPGGLCFVTSKHRIAKPADLIGLTLGGGQSSPMQALVPTWLKANGVDPGKVKLLQLDPALVGTALVEDKIDAGECWEGNSLPLFKKRAADAGVSIGRIAYSDFGLDIYGSGLLTSDAMIADHPDTVRAFLAATYQGYRDAAGDPDAAVAIMVKRFPMLDPAITREQIVQTAALMKGAEQGAFEPGRVASSVAFLKQAYPDKAAGVGTELFDGSLLPVAAKP